jgi:arylformamidase
MIITWTDLSIPLCFNGAQPSFFGVPRARSSICHFRGLLGDVRQGGGCNFESYELIPQCNGTHTECVGHLTSERISIRNCLVDVMMSALLISIQPVDVANSNESYACPLQMGDRLITQSMLAEAIGSHQAKALIIRTLPLSHTSPFQSYNNETVPFFSNDAMHLINHLGFRHLLVDLPSIDRLDDEGKLSNHRIFWGMKPGSFDTPSTHFCTKTITEFIYVPSTVQDGRYKLNLQIAPFDTESAPSRPMICLV